MYVPMRHLLSVNYRKIARISSNFYDFRSTLSTLKKPARFNI